MGTVTSQGICVSQELQPLQAERTRQGEMVRPQDVFTPMGIEIRVADIANLPLPFLASCARPNAVAYNLDMLPSSLVCKLDQIACS